MLARTPSPSAPFSALLARFSPETIALVKRSLPKLRRSLPGSTQLVYDYSNSLVVAFGLSEHGIEAVVALAIDPRRVRLCFNNGKFLPDPKGLLEGSGAAIRSVTLKAASNLDNRDIQALLIAAIKHSGLAFSPTRSSRMVFRSASKKARPKRTRDA